MKIYSFNTALYNNKKNNSLFVSPKISNTVSFSAISTEQKIANKYYNDFIDILDHKEAVSQEDYKKSIKGFFAKISKENAVVQKKFLEKHMSDNDSVFAQCMYLKYIDEAMEVLKLYNNIDEKTLNNFWRKLWT